MTKVGLFGIGLDTYWAQFDGLPDNLKTYKEQIKNRIAGYGVEVAGPILEIGNTKSRYHFSSGAKRFMNEWSKQGPAHHCAIGVGHISDKIQKLGQILSIQVVKIC